ncbi:threonine/serine exporter ThrE family protein [Desemzia sp. FAM 23989]|uniref:threonine/serine ThrE exporter family protein n=1 Tax=Desemzia sp. FAM 23989 TaxID=3259523 RepID=UPI003885B9F8
MKTKELINFVLDIGEQMLISGAEVNRVEDSITRMCSAYGAKRVNVLTITSSIILTVRMLDGELYTQTRRIRSYVTDLNKLDRLNHLSRVIVNQQPSLEEIEHEIEQIDLIGVYSTSHQYFIYALVASSFTVFFGGNVGDTIVSALVAMLLKWMISFIKKVDKNTVITNLFCSFVVGIVTILTVNLGFGTNVDHIIIGNIMLLIPGLALTNAVKDIISGDTISGLLRLSEAFVTAVSIASGFSLATLLMGGLI